MQHMWVLLFVGFGLPTATVAARWWAQRAQQAQQEAAASDPAQSADAGQLAQALPGQFPAGSSSAEPAASWADSKSSSSVHAGSNSTPTGPGSSGSGSDVSDGSSHGRPPLPARLHSPLVQLASWLVLAPAAGVALWSALEVVAAP